MAGTWDPWIRRFSVEGVTGVCIAGHDGTQWGNSIEKISAEDISTLVCAYEDGEAQVEAVQGGIRIGDENYIFISCNDRRIFGRRAGGRGIVIVTTSEFIVIATHNDRITSNACVCAIENICDELLRALGKDPLEKWETSSMLTKSASKF